MTRGVVSSTAGSVSRCSRLVAGLRAAVAVAAALAATAAPVVLGARPAGAHEPGTTGITLAVAEDAVVARFDVPLTPLEEALGTTVPTDVVQLSQSRELVVGYIADHFEVSSGADIWTETFGRLTAITVGGVQSLRIDATLEPASDTTGPGEFSVAYDGLIEHDDSQRVFVTVLDETGTVSLAGVIDSDTATLSVGGVDGEGAGSAIGTMIGEGFDHVLDGADHMLFLLVLLIPAPLAAVRGRWLVSGTSWRALRKVVQVATAFTVGHSLTLAISALGWVTFPTRTIEVLIGVSVAVSALHAIRPLVAHGEVVIAAGFGLVHGLAFAGILDDLGLQSASVRALFGFNLGIEAAQVVIVGLTFPSLLIMSRRRIYPAVRVTAATLALAAATGWVVERLGVAESPFRPIESAVVDHLGWVVAALAIGAAATTLAGRVLRRPSAAGAQLQASLDLIA